MYIHLKIYLISTGCQVMESYWVGWRLAGDWIAASTQFSDV